MTTLYQKSVTCANCQHAQMVTGIASTNSFGSPDLDTRPPEMKRSTINTWVQSCESCGYCAESLEIENKKAPTILNSRQYQEQLREPDTPQLANHFLCKAIIDQKSGDFAAATWSLLHAAWVCDDLGNEHQAKQCRQDAAKMLLRAEKKKQILMNHTNEETLLLVDLLRRSCQFEQAKQVIASRRKAMIEDHFLLQILDYQHQLVEAADSAAYTIEDAIEIARDHE
jgi:hypothetical protein